MSDELDLLQLHHSLTGSHLSAAIIASGEAKASGGPFRLLTNHHKAMTSALHGFAALESGMNLAAYHLFEQVGGPHYIPDNSRNVELCHFVKNWQGHRLSVVEKLRYLASLGGNEVPGRVNSLVSEFATLRNWIAHGLIFQTISLVSKSGPHSLSVHDWEEFDRKGSPQDWKKPFPNAKFSPLHALNHEDGEIAVAIAIEALSVVSRATKLVFPFVDHSGGVYRAYSVDDQTEPGELTIRIFGRLPYR